MKLEKLKKPIKDLYVEPNQMWEELDSFYKRFNVSKKPEAERMSDELGRMIDDIATKLGFMGKFINYSFIDDMRGDARVKMVKAVYDCNFSLWSNVFCTPVNKESDRAYVVIFNKSRCEWDDKKTYLKPWDTINELYELPVVKKLDGSDMELTMDDGNGNTVPIRHSITMRNNPFSYFTKIAYHAFVNRIKKEKKAGEVLAAYQEKIYEEAYSSGHGWENVKRQALEDENEYFYEDNEDIYKEDIDAVPAEVSF